MPKHFSAVIIVSIFVVFGCRSESGQSQTKEIIFGKFEFSDGWARPGSEGQISGAYLTISNGTASSDTLLSVISKAAEQAEVHETYQDETGATGMRPAGKLAVKSGYKLNFEPGGLHIMLMNLKRDLAVGDSLAVSLEFARAGTKTVRIPVKIQN